MAESVELVCHRERRPDVVRRISVGISRGANDLRLAFALDADLARLRIPGHVPPRIGRDLWRHTCFEAFLGVDGTTAYHELNFAPSGEWAAFAFRDYRDGGPLDDASVGPSVAVRRAGNRLQLDVIVTLERLSAAYPRARLRIGIAAVVEEEHGELSYWSLRHPPGKPDFHHGDAFVLRLEPPAGAC